MNRTYVIFPLLGLAAFAAVYRQWEAEQCFGLKNAQRLAATTDYAWSPFEEYKHRDGAKEARADLKDGKLALCTYGLPVEWAQYYRAILAAKYGVQTRVLAGCVVSQELCRYAADYNTVMEKEIVRRFGADVFDRTANEAEKRSRERNHFHP
jgi:hypothetical protein